MKELQILLEDLFHAVEAVSGELVQLLLENDALQQESDARNIAIEQLLQMAVKNSENELKPVQMSVILPSDESDPI
ncbi:SCHIP-1 domain-containing protein [Nephila pilipes]|uniref:SCHIP-1 domain-containing protein n=1 Tax=Nephila pilipes TaxID=299642 RepID=A0A8X6QB27_NEPPI|nr:SCHIP-1 domain-containing protein [Nephila pilipes]